MAAVVDLRKYLWREKGETNLVESKGRPYGIGWKPSSSATHAPFFLFTSRGWWRAWAVGSTLVKPKIEEFRHGSDLTLKINKRFKTSFTGTSHRKRFYIFVSKDKEKKEMGEGQNSKLGPWGTYDFWPHAYKQNVGWTHRPPLALAQKGNFEIHLCPLLPSPKHCLLSVNLLWIGLAHLWNLC